jgi:hypothetical protein
MTADRYLRFILTVIAVELLWLGVRTAAPPAYAQPQQARQEPAPVVITGIRIGKQDYTTLPVALAGSIRPGSIPSAHELPNLQPAGVRVSDPVVVDTRQPLSVQVANQPLTIQSGARPVVVDVIPAKPGARPGL